MQRSERPRRTCGVHACGWVPVSGGRYGDLDGLWCDPVRALLMAARAEPSARTLTGGGSDHRDNDSRAACHCPDAIIQGGAFRTGALVVVARTARVAKAAFTWAPTIKAVGMGAFNAAQRGRPGV